MQHGNNNHFLIFFIAKGSFNNIQRIFSHKKYNKSMLGVLSSLSLFSRKENLGDIHKHHPRAS